MRIIAAAAFIFVSAASAHAAYAQAPPMSALPAILALQPDQHAAWRAYKDAAALDRADQLHQAQSVDELNAMTTPQRLDAMLNQMRDNQGAFQRHVEATKAFYAALSPEQKATFDRVTRLPGAPPPGRRDTSRHAEPPEGGLRMPPGLSNPPPGGAYVGVSGQ